MPGDGHVGGVPALLECLEPAVDVPPEPAIQLLSAARAVGKHVDVSIGKELSEIWLALPIKKHV